MFDLEETQRPQSIDTFIYQDVWEEMEDEVQHGKGNVLGMGGTIANKGRVSKDDEDLKKRKESDPIDETPKTKKPLEEEEGEIKCIF